MSDVPEGFTILERVNSPFLTSLGPLYAKGHVIGMRVEERHLNTRGLAHGGMLLTLADSALGIVIAMSRTPPVPMVTVSLSADFTGAARGGDFIEARVNLDKLGKRLAFASCQLWCGERRVLRASGVFAHVPRDDLSDG